MINFLTRLGRRLLVGQDQQFVFVRADHLAPPSLKTISLYIHIPFCKNICPYCPYNRVPYDKEMAPLYKEAMLREIDQYSARLGKTEISSIYIGGGTPTTLVDDLGVILHRLRETFAVSGEICIETTPGDLHESTVRRLKDYGVEMISVGVQSFCDRLLGMLGRNYDSERIRSSVELVVSSNFKTVNLDLMFALPSQSNEEVLYDLKRAVETGATQITTYPLFTFPYSSVGSYLKIKRVRMPNLSLRRRTYRTIHDFLTEQGYQRVSVWGFKKGTSPRYSSVTRDNYIGLGAGACSKLPGIFYLNTFSVKEYIDMVSGGNLPVALTMRLTQQLEHYYWLYWRLYETHLDRQRIRDVFGGEGMTWRVLLGLAKLLGFCKEQQSQITLTEKGAFWIHLLQNHFILNYINKVWSAAISTPWPERIEI